MKSIRELKPINKKAVALFYDHESGDKHKAPIVTAKGTRELAEEILHLAHEHDIPVFENPGLASLLSTLEIGDEVPPLVYVTVAELIAFAYSLKK